MFKTISAFIVGLMLVGCTVNQGKATRILESQGYKNVQLNGYAFFGCSKGDEFHSKFTAIGFNGQPVSGVICDGILKGAIVRLD